MTHSDVPRLKRYGLLAIAGVALVVLAFELSHDFAPWFLAGGVLGIVVLVASAFSAVARPVGYALGGVTMVLLGVSAFVDEGSMMGVLFVYVAFLLFWSANRER